MDKTTGERRWKSEISSIDTALLLGGVLSVRQCFQDDAEIMSIGDENLRTSRFQMDAQRKSASAFARLATGNGFYFKRAGTLTANTRCFIFWQSARRPIRFRPKRGMRGKEISSLTAIINI
jgi:hypothetical protein